MIGKDEKLRLKELLSSAILLLCKNGLPFSDHFSLEALIGVTLDQKEVLLFSFNETIQTSSNIDESLSVSQSNKSQRNTQNISNKEDIKSQDTFHSLDNNFCANIEEHQVIDNVFTGAASSQSQIKSEAEGDYNADDDCVYIPSDEEKLEINEYTAECKVSVDQYVNYERYNNVDDISSLTNKNYADYTEDYSGTSDLNRNNDRSSSMRSTLQKRAHRPIMSSLLCRRNQSSLRRGSDVKRTISRTFTRRRRNESLRDAHDFQQNDVTQMVNGVLQHELDTLCTDASAEKRNDISALQDASTEPLLQCQVCGTTLKGTRTLREHIRGTHLNLYSYSCSECGLGFKWRSSLKNHRAQCHEQRSAVAPGLLTTDLF